MLSFVMQPEQRVVTVTPIQELWDDRGTVNASRSRDLAANELRELLRAGRYGSSSSTSAHIRDGCPWQIVSHSGKLKSKPTSQHLTCRPGSIISLTATATSPRSGRRRLARRSLFLRRHIDVNCSQCEGVIVEESERAVRHS